MASPSVLGPVYSIFLCRMSTFTLTIAVGVLFFERAFDQGGDAIYDSISQGKLWKHIKNKYEEE